MKLQSLVSATLFAAIAALSLGAQAAPDTEKSATETQAEKPMGKKMKTHSHVEEKTGVAQKAPETTPDEKSDKPKAGTDKSKHYHPRDGK